MLGTAIMELSEEIVGAPVILIWIRDRQSFCRQAPVKLNAILVLSWVGVFLHEPPSPIAINLLFNNI